MSTATKAPPIDRTEADMPPVEIYTDERAASFLLTAAIDAEEYESVRQLVRDEFGLDPDTIDHLPPPDAAAPGIVGGDVAAENAAS